MDKVLGIIRHILTFLGGILVARGVIDESTAMEISAAIITIIGVVWSIVDKKQRTGVGNG